MNKNDLVGHKEIVQNLTSAIGAGKISHAYILSGEKGMGKKYLAKYFAKLLQCENPVPGEDGLKACCKCRSCLQTDGGNQPDIVYVTHEKAGIGVDDIRTQVNADIAIKPYSSKYKIYIIDDADKMTDQAQNALLKTVEEPPEYGIIFMLAANSANLLQTIHSRCVELQLRSTSKEQIREYLTECLEVNGIIADVAAAFSGGNIGKAIAYATSEEFDKEKEDVLEFLRKADNAALSDIMTTVKNLEGYKNDIKECIDIMLFWYRDILMYKSTGDEKKLIFKDEKKYIINQSRKFTFEKLDRALDAMEVAKKRVDSNVALGSTLELMLINMLA